MSDIYDVTIQNKRWIGAGHCAYLDLHPQLHNEEAHTMLWHAVEVACRDMIMWRDPASPIKPSHTVIARNAISKFRLYIFVKLDVLVETLSRAMLDRTGADVRIQKRQNHQKASTHRKISHA